jgi:nucleotide-binding universal stress UspA family protein
MKRILVPLDGSTLAEAALPAAARIAEATGAELLLLHVIETSPPGEIHGERHLRDAKEATTYLAARAGDLAGAKAAGAVKVSAHVHEEGSQDAAKAIGEHAEEFRSDLVVIATHGAHRFGRFLKGSVAQRALFFGGAPVLTLPASGPRDPGLWKTLVVAVDGSGEHLVPLDWLGDLARSLGLAVELLLVVDTRVSLSGDKMAIARSMPGATTWALEAAVVAGESWLAGLAASPELAGIVVRTDLLRGSPDKALAERERGRSGDIVVIETHGRVGLDALWEGSMAAKIVSRLESEVLLVPARIR